jgi:cobalt-zinc-cadmium efflux system protein
MAEDHVHTHSHAHAPKDFGAAFALAAALNVALVIAQVVYGLSAHSVALLADAGHNLSDVLGLLLAWGAYVLARVRPTEQFTYGYRSASILSALINAALILIATGAIAWEAVRRLADPGEVAGATVMVVAALGIVVNGISAWLLMAGRKGDLNIRGAFVHMLADAGVSAAVVAAGAVIYFTGWTWADPLATLVISAVIVWTTWGLLREAARMSLDAVPQGIEPAKVRQHLETLPGVASVHDLHIWAVGTTENALTVHLVMPGGHPGDAFLSDLCHALDHEFKINHATVQIELADAGACALAPPSTL